MRYIMVEMTRVAGVDGCPGGWVAAVVSTAEPATPVSWRLLADARAVLALLDECAVVGIDIPIGLPTDGPRACDVAARARLGPRRSSVFPAPMRAVLDAVDYADACARSRSASGRALPLQAWHITPRIADVDDAMTPALQARLLEVHPEVSLAELAGAVLPPKKLAAGGDARIAALQQWRPDVATEVAARPRPARSDDAIDALACAWTAERWLRGVAEVLPPDPPRDSRGLLMAIVV
jgi:predicted RNase H-like nuclease